MEKMHMLKSTLEREIDKIAGKGSMNAGDLEMVSKLLWSLKNACKIEMYEDGGYSQDGGMWRAEGGYSDRRGYRMSRADGMSYGDNGGYSGRRRRDTRGRFTSYSMNDAKHEMIEDLREMMEMEGIEPHDREVLKKAMEQLSR